MAVNPTVPAKTVAQFIALAKSRPGKLSYGSGGTGGAGHLATEYFRLLTRIDLVHVPYRGTGLAVIDVISGQLDMVMADPRALAHYGARLRKDLAGICPLTEEAVIPEGLAETGLVTSQAV